MLDRAEALEVIERLPCIRTLQAANDRSARPSSTL